MITKTRRKSISTDKNSSTHTVLPQNKCLYKRRGWVGKGEVSGKMIITGQVIWTPPKNDAVTYERPIIACCQFHCCLHIFNASSFTSNHNKIGWLESHIVPSLAVVCSRLSQISEGFLLPPKDFDFHTSFDFHSVQGLTRPISVSFLIRTSGKYHSQAGSTRSDPIAFLQ